MKWLNGSRDGHNTIVVYIHNRWSGTLGHTAVKLFIINAQHLWVASDKEIIKGWVAWFLKIVLDAVVVNLKLVTTHMSGATWYHRVGIICDSQSLRYTECPASFGGLRFVARKFEDAMCLK